MLRLLFSEPIERLFYGNCLLHLFMPSWWELTHHLLFKLYLVIKKHCQQCSAVLKLYLVIALIIIQYFILVSCVFRILCPIVISENKIEYN